MTWGKEVASNLKIGLAGRVIHWTDWYQQNRKPASDEQKRRMKGLLQRGYTHAEAADLVSCVYDDMGRLFQKPPKVIEGASPKKV